MSLQSQPNCGRAQPDWAFDAAQSARKAAKADATAQDAALNNGRLNAADLIGVSKGFAEQQVSPAAV